MTRTYQQRSSVAPKLRPSPIPPAATHFRATGITTYLQKAGTLEHTQIIAKKAAKARRASGERI
jgi:hypothetical protein